MKHKKMFIITLFFIVTYLFSQDIIEFDKEFKRLLSDSFHLYYHDHNFKKAVKLLEECIKKFPKEEEKLMVIMGSWYEENGYYEKANEIYTNVINKYGSFSSYVHRFQLNIKLKKMEKAEKDWEIIKNMDLKVASIEYLTRIMIYIYYKNYNKALLDINKSINEDSKSSYMLIIRSRIYYEKKNYIKALTDIKKAIEIRTKKINQIFVSDYLWLSIIYYKLAEYQKSF